MYPVYTTQSINSSTLPALILFLFSLNKPYVNPKTIVPAMLGGKLWGVGMSMLFVANDILTQTITYPIVTT